MRTRSRGIAGGSCSVCKILNPPLKNASIILGGGSLPTSVHLPPGPRRDVLKPHFQGETDWHSPWRRNSTQDLARLSNSWERPSETLPQKGGLLFLGGGAQHVQGKARYTPSRIFIPSIPGDNWMLLYHFLQGEGPSQHCMRH